MNMLRCFCGGIRRLAGKYVFSWSDQPTLRVTLLRWVTLILYGWLAALVVYPLLPLLTHIRPEEWLPLGGHPGLYYFLMLTYALVAVLLVLYLQSTFFIRLPRKQFKRGYCIDLQGWLRYPTLHLSVIGGLGFLGYLGSVSDSQVRSAFIFGITNESGMPLRDYGGLILFLMWYSLFQVLSSESNQVLDLSGSEPQGEAIDLETCSDSVFKEWLEAEGPAERIDFMDREPYVKRIKERLCTSHNSQREKIKGQVILGDFGSGKTTIVRMVEHRLPSEWIVSHFDCWQRSAQPEELAAQFMEQIVHDVGQHIEAASLARLPDAFANALYGSSHWFNLLNVTLRPKVPEVVVQSLNDLLFSNNRKLLIVVENVDRNSDSDLFVDVISAILDKMRVNSDSQIQFIFSASEKYVKSESIYRIADYKEEVDTFLPIDIILRFITFCFSESLDGLPNGEKIVLPYLPENITLADASSTSSVSVGRALDLLPYDKDSWKARLGQKPVGHIVLLSLSHVLSNPRIMKHVLRKTYNLWSSSLEGEINLLDLLLYVTSIEDGKLKDRLNNYPREAYDASKGSPFHYFKNDSIKNDEETGEPPFREVLANYIYNGYIYNGQPTRARISQPFIYVNGYGDTVYRKYVSLLKKQSVTPSHISDQHLIRSYISANSPSSTESAVRKSLELFVDNFSIYSNTIETMSKCYYVSTGQLYQYTSNVIKYGGMKYCYESDPPYQELLKLCYKLINMNRDGVEQDISLLESRLSESLEYLYHRRKFRILLYIVKVGLIKDAGGNYYDVLIRPFTRILDKFSPEIIEYQISRNEVEILEVLSEYEDLLMRLESKVYYIKSEVIKKSCHLFLTFLGASLRFYQGVNIIEKIVNNDSSNFRHVVYIIYKTIGTEINSEIEHEAWIQVQRFQSLSEFETE